MKNDASVSAEKIKIAKQLKDFSPASGKLIFASNDQFANITVNILSDNDAEDMEYFQITLDKIKVLEQSTFYPIMPVFQKIYIYSNGDYFGVFSISFYKTQENYYIINEELNKFITVLVRKTGGERFRTTVFVMKEMASASEDDIQFDDSTIVFNERETEKKIVIGIKNDNIPEDEEFLFLKLVNPSNNARVDSKKGSIKVIILSSDAYLGEFFFATNLTVVDTGFCTKNIITFFLLYIYLFFFFFKM